MSAKPTLSQEMLIAKTWVNNVLEIGPARHVAVPVCRHQGWGTLQLGKSISDGILRLNGQTFEKGLGTHSPSDILIKVSGPARRFCALAGIDDNSMTRSVDHRMIFSLEVAGREIWKSSPLAVSDPPARVEVDLNGASEFLLKIRETEGRINYAHVNWVDPKVVLMDGQEIELAGEGYFPGPPFSFRYGGSESSALLPAWNKKHETIMSNKEVTCYRVTYTDPKTGLECILDLKEYNELPAVEWVLHFKNTGRQDTPILENILPLDLACSGLKKPMLHYSYGSNLRLDDFLYMQKPLAPNEPMRLTSGGGRSSEEYLPFFNVADSSGGLITALGWTGQWAAEILPEQNLLQLRAGMEKTHFKLLPGEEVRTPSILLVFWKGSEPIRGNNLLRRLILQHHTYRPDGKTIPAPITIAHWGGMKSPLQFDRINVIKEHCLDYDYYWIDAGWYGPADSYSPDEFIGDWGSHVGNWAVNPVAHPNGLKPISDAVHAAGMKFLLWFEPERAIFGTPLTEEHPEWFLGDKVKGSNTIFNLAIPEARKWMTDFVSGMLTEHGVDCYRQDFNISPLPFWRTNDAPDRQGITEIKYIEGLYAFWDGLLRRHPGLIIDNCASGGRRIDLETTGRSIPLWRSDIQCWPNFDPTAGQVQTAGLAHWVPCSTTGTGMRPGDTYNFRSAMCTGVQFSIFAYERNPIDPNYPYDWHRKMIADQRRAIPYFLGDYYPLLPCTTSADDWMLYQMHRDDLNEGLVLAFRRENSPFISGSFKLKGLKEKAVYQFEDADSGTTWECDGKSLTDAGLQITLETSRSTRLIFYRKK